MAKNFGRVNVSITASTGGLTRGLAGASKQLTGFQGMVSRLTGGMGNGFASATLGILGLGRGASTAAVGVAVLSTAMKSLLLPLGIIAAIAAPFTAIASAMSYAEGVHNLATELGVASGNLQVMQHAAAEVGVSQERLTGGLRRVARMTSELAAGTPAAVKAFANLGLTMQDLAGLDTTQQFALIADRMRALPPEMQAAAAIDIFGRSGQGMLNFVRQGGDGIREMDTLLTNLGVKMSGEQTAAIEGMGDALGRLILPVKGFILQFTAGVAPAITAVSNLIVGFFSENTKGWSLASTAAAVFTGVLRGVVGAFTVLYGVFQIIFAINAKLSQAFSAVFSVILSGVQSLAKSLARLAEAAGFTNLADSLNAGAAGAGKMQRGIDKLGKEYGSQAAEGFANGIANITNPFGAFDAALAKAKKDAEDNATGRAKDAPAASPVGQAIGAAIRASTQELKAIVVGTSEGETFRNNILRGGDPRLDVKDDARATADNTERSADALEDIADRLDPTGLAVIG